MSRKHRWDESKASTARVNFGINEKRGKKNTTTGKARQNGKRWQCPNDYCMREVIRIKNHLRQFHKLELKDVKRYAERAKQVLSKSSASSSSLSSSSSSSASSEDSAENIDRYFHRKLHCRDDNAVFKDVTDDESDSEFISYKYFRKVKTKWGNCFRKLKIIYI